MPLGMARISSPILASSTSSRVRPRQNGRISFRNAAMSSWVTSNRSWGRVGRVSISCSTHFKPDSGNMTPARIPAVRFPTISSPGSIRSVISSNAVANALARNIFTGRSGCSRYTRVTIRACSMDTQRGSEKRRSFSCCIRLEGACPAPCSLIDLHPPLCL